MAEANGGGVTGTHGITDDGAVICVFDGAILGFDHGHDVSEKVFFHKVAAAAEATTAAAGSATACAAAGATGTARATCGTCRRAACGRSTRARCAAGDCRATSRGATCARGTCAAAWTATTAT